MNDTRQFILPADKWKLFVEALDKPPVVKPQLQKLFSEPTVLECEQVPARSRTAVTTKKEIVE